jgi:heme/copper-type cytochrome/quinol oxidase subunit 2
MMPGSAPWRPTSYASPVAMLVLAIGCLALGWWANGEAQNVRATDVWVYNALAAIAFLVGVLFLPFAGAAFYRVRHNRRATGR